MMATRSGLRTPKRSPAAAAHHQQLLNAPAFTPTRRSSVAGIGQRPPLPTAITVPGISSIAATGMLIGRRQSLDGLLDECTTTKPAADEKAAGVAANAATAEKSAFLLEGASENKVEPLSNETTIGLAQPDGDDIAPIPQRRRSRIEAASSAAAPHASVTDDDADIADAADDNNADDDDDDVPDGVECPRGTDSIIVHNARVPWPTMKSTGEDIISHPNSLASSESARSAATSTSSVADAKSPPRTFLNRYVKKVKSFIKK